MPWQLSQRDGQWCVVKVGEENPVPGGCHASRAEAIRHQRALYAAEARVASIYDRLDAETQEHVPSPPPEPAPSVTSPELKIVVSQESALTASVAGMLETMAERMDNEKQQTAALVAALQASAERETPHVTVEAPQITVEAAPTPEVHVAAPQVTVNPAPPPEIHVEAPQVTVRPEIVLPERKNVVFTRDRAGRISGASIEED